MNRRKISVFLEDILYAIDKIGRYTSGMDQTFKENELVVDAVLRNLEIIGEASAQIPNSLRAEHSHIAWKRMVGLRNIVIHAYFNVDLNIVWQIITQNIPTVKNDIQSMRDSLRKE